MDRQTSIFDYVTNPILQASLSLGFGVLFLFFGACLYWLGIMEWDENFPWTTAGTFMLFYALFSSIISLKAEDLNEYWKKSILSYIVLTGVLILLAYLITGKTVGEAASFSWIFKILTFSFLAFLSIISIVKGAFNYLVKGDES